MKLEEVAKRYYQFRDRFEVVKVSKNGGFNCLMMRVNVSVNEIRPIFFFCVLCGADCRSIFLRCGGPLERQKQDSHVFRKTGTLPLFC